MSPSNVLDPKARQQLEQFRQGLQRLEGFVSERIEAQADYWGSLRVERVKERRLKLPIIRKQLGRLLLYAAIFLGGFVLGHGFHHWSGIPELPITPITPATPAPTYDPTAY